MRVIYRADFYTVFGPKADIVGQVLDCVCVFVDACMLAYVWFSELTCIPYSGLRRTLFGQVLGPRLCVYVGACMLVCVWYTELTCITYSGLRRALLVRSSSLDSVCV